jgi:integrase
MAAIAEDPNEGTCRHPDLAHGEEVLMIQQGQVFKLASVARDSGELWAYRKARRRRLRRAAARQSAATRDRRLADDIRPGYRFEATQALRQVLQRAVVWGMLDVNPAKHGVENPQRRATEKRPFESWDEVESVAAKLRGRQAPMVIFAAATGLRPGEWVALEQRDVDREARVVYVRRSFSKGRLKCTKTEARVRAVPLQAIALSALDRLPVGTGSNLLFPAVNGGYLDLPAIAPRSEAPDRFLRGESSSLDLRPCRSSWPALWMAPNCRSLAAALVVLAPVGLSVALPRDCGSHARRRPPAHRRPIRGLAVAEMATLPQELVVGDGRPMWRPWAKSTP